jgi:tripartite-type tricarboxylate transporter receptor subunit TctC
MKKIIVGLLAALFAAAALAQSSPPNWPQRPVRFIVPFPPGGATDISARLLGEKLSQIWGQTVVIENRGGAGGSLGAAEAARAAPDGYTLFFPSGSVVTANQHIYAKLGYDPEKDFVPITKVVSGPQVLTVPASSPFKSVKDLVDYARANPGKVTFGHAGIGSQTHLAAENFVWQAKIDALAVPYKGEGPGLAASIAGETNFFLGNLAAALGHIQGGRLRALGVTSKGEAAQLPGVPPIGKTIPGFDADTNPALVASDLRGRLYVQGLAPVGNTPEQMAREMKEETALWARVVKERKIEVK